MVTVAQFKPKTNSEITIPVPESPVPILVSLADLDDNPWQPRLKVNQSTLDALKNSILRLGFTGYLEGRRNPDYPGRIQIVFGHRRKLAAGLAGIKELPVLIRPFTDDQMAELALLENASQEEMSYWDQAMTIRRMIDDHGYTIRKFEDVFGWSRGFVTNRLEIARLDRNSPLAAAARKGQADITTIQTLAKLQLHMSDTEITELLAAAQNKTINADQLKKLNKALVQGRTDYDKRLFDEDGHEQTVITLAEQRRLQEEARRTITDELEGRYREQTAAERAAQRPVSNGPSFQIPVQTIEYPPGVLRKDNPDQPVTSEWRRISAREPEPINQARLAIEQLRDNVRYLRRKLEQADWTTLNEDELQEWQTLKQEMITLLA